MLLPRKRKPRACGPGLVGVPGPADRSTGRPFREPSLSPRDRSRSPSATVRLDNTDFESVFFPGRSRPSSESLPRSALLGPLPGLGHGQIRCGRYRDRLATEDSSHRESYLSFLALVAEDLSPQVIPLPSDVFWPARTAVVRLPHRGAMDRTGYREKPPASRLGRPRSKRRARLPLARLSIRIE